MKRLNGLFVLLILILGLLSIAYIWKSEDDREILEAEVAEQTQEINYLKNEISELNTENNSGNVSGSTTSIGIVTGEVKFNNLNLHKNTIVCAQDKFTIKEFCTDELIETNDPTIFEYTLEIPKGEYFVYAITPPESEKVFYSNVQKCFGDENCDPKGQSESNGQILLQIIEDEVQRNINLYL